MSIDYAAILTALYNRAAVDLAGASVRALLGASGSLFAATDLTAKADAKPRLARPWLVWRPGPVGGASGGMRDVAASWWIYDDLTAGDSDLNAITTALEALYGAESRFALSGGRISVTQIGQIADDDALALRGREVRIVFTRRG